MGKTSHRRFHLIALATFGLVALHGATVAQADDLQADYFGRWTVKDEKPVFSAKGKLYKTVDVAPCGADFCGVSVADSGACGPVLFRFLTIHAKNTTLTGHGKWGDLKKKVVVQYWLDDTQKPVVLIGLGGNDYDPESREGSMATYEAEYKRDGGARCKADSPKVGDLSDDVNADGAS